MTSNTENPFTLIINKGTFAITVPDDSTPKWKVGTTHIELMVDYNADGTPVLEGFFLGRKRSNCPLAISTDLMSVSGFNYTCTTGEPLPRPVDGDTSPFGTLLHRVWEYGHHPDFQPPPEPVVD